MKLTGGSLKINELMLLLKASYEEHSDKNILTYELDKKLSNLYGKVYVDNINKKLYWLTEEQDLKIWAQIGLII